MSLVNRTKRSWLFVLLMLGTLLGTGGCDAELTNELALQAAGNALADFISELINAGVVGLIEG